MQAELNDKQALVGKEEPQAPGPRNRKGTDLSSSQNTQSLRANGALGGQAGGGANRNNKEEEIKLPIIKIEQNLPSVNPLI